LTVFLKYGRLAEMRNILIQYVIYISKYYAHYYAALFLKNRSLLYECVCVCTYSVCLPIIWLNDLFSRKIIWHVILFFADFCSSEYYIANIAISQEYTVFVFLDQISQPQKQSKRTFVYGLWITFTCLPIVPIPIHVV